MVAEVREYAVTIPHGTTVTAPHVQKLTMPVRIVTRVRYQVPPGPRGVMGFALANGGVRVIPINSAPYIVTDNSIDALDLSDHVDSGTWQLIGYNTGTYTHTVYLTFTLTLPKPAPPTGGTLIGTAPPATLPAWTLVTGTTGTVATVVETTGTTTTPGPPPAPSPTPIIVTTGTTTTPTAGASTSPRQSGPTM